MFIISTSPYKRNIRQYTFFILHLNCTPSRQNKKHGIQHLFSFIQCYYNTKQHLGQCPFVWFIVYS